VEKSKRDKPDKSKCPFCRIVADETKGLVVFRDSISIAFLDEKPLFPGHTLLVPMTHFPTLESLPNELVGNLFQRVQLVAQAIELAMSADGTFVALNDKVSQSVPHTHIHIVPRRRKDGLRGFFWPRQAYSSVEAAKEIREKIRSQIEILGSKPRAQR
jgi:histidine triad (HIT) family protein